MRTVKVDISVILPSLQSFAGVMRIALSSPNVVDSSILAHTPPVEVNIYNGVATIDLIPNSEIAEGSYYTLTLKSKNTLGTGIMTQKVGEWPVVVPPNDCNIADIIVIEPPILPEPVQLEVWVAQVRSDMIAAEISADRAKLDADRAEQALADIDIDAEHINQAVEQASSASVKAIAAQGKAEEASVSASLSATEAGTIRDEVVTIGNTAVSAIKAEGAIQLDKVAVASTVAIDKAGEASASATKAAQSEAVATTKANEATDSATSAKASEESSIAIKNDIIDLQDSTVAAVNLAGTTQVADIETTGAEQLAAVNLAGEKAEAEAGKAAQSALSSASSASAAEVSETSASTSAGIATTKASEADTSADNAKVSETSASTSATNALTSETNAKESETIASSKATEAEISAQKAETANLETTAKVDTHNLSEVSHVDIRQDIIDSQLWLKESKDVVQAYPVPESVLDVQSHFEPYETPPAEGEKSPDNPSTIKGWREIECIRCGRNLGEVAYFSGANYGTVTEDNGVYTKITETPSESDRFVFEFPLEYFKIGQTYTISYDLDFSGKTYIMVDVSEARDNSQYYQWYGYNKFTFIAKAPPTKECKYLTVYVYTETQDMPVGTVNTLSNLQIERASASTPYTPYEDDTYTVDLGKEYGGGYVDWARGVFVQTHKTIDLSEITNWKNENDTTTNTQVFTFIDWDTKRNQFPPCTHFIGRTVYYGSDREGIWQGGSPAIWLRINKDRLSEETPDGLMTWIKAQPQKIILYLELWEPIEHPITPQLITALAQADRYTPKLNSVFSDTNLPTTVGYAKSPIQEHTDITNAIVATGGANV